jgi:protease-4
VEAPAYFALHASDPGWRPWLRDLPRVAYVVAEGAIHRGGGLRGIACDSYRVLLEHLSRDAGVCGVVVRVASPGGDGLASDLLHRALSVLRREKPVVVSMGEVAASGGYYLAAGADAVLAESATVTGSIGVVGGKLNLAGLYERFGIARDAVERGARAGMLSETRGFTPGERSALRREMESLYETFLARVAEGRSLSRDSVAKVAGGRVFSGARAARLGLVDRLGGPLEALAEVRRRAGLAPDERVLVEVHPRAPRLPGLGALLGLLAR